MVRLLTLLFLILLALASTAGYFIIDQKISAGRKQIEEGKRKLESGHPALAYGRERMEAGRRELSEGQERYDSARKNFFLVLADNLLKGGKGFEEARTQIDEGLERIAKGEVELREGEKRIYEGELELLRGRERINQAGDIRGAFGFSALFFASLAVLLGFLWRQSLSRRNVV